MPAKPGQSLEKIRTHLFTPPGVTLPVLTPKENAKLARFKLIIQEMAERPYQTDATLRAWIMTQYERTWHEADDDIANVRRVYAVTNMGKEQARYTVTQILLKSLEIAMAKRDTEAMIAIADKLGKYYKLDKDEMVEIPWEQILPPQFIITADPAVLGLKIIDSKRRAELQKKYLGEIQEAEIVDDANDGE
jgi:hypothetical protein